MAAVARSSGSFASASGAVRPPLFYQDVNAAHREALLRAANDPQSVAFANRDGLGVHHALDIDPEIKVPFDLPTFGLAKKRLAKRMRQTPDKATPPPVATNKASGPQTAAQNVVLSSMMKAFASIMMARPSSNGGVRPTAAHPKYPWLPSNHPLNYQ